MKPNYRLLQRRDRGNVYYLRHVQTGRRECLKTTDRQQAERILTARNQTADAPALNLAVGLAHIKNADPTLATRTWQVAIDDYITHGKEVSQQRSARELTSAKFDLIRHKPIVATTKEDLKAVLRKGGATTDNFLRRLHNLALHNGWIHTPILAASEWRKRPKKLKRGITAPEQTLILAAEQNVERRHYYELLWHIGAAQTDGACLVAECVDWNVRVLSYQRRKTGEWCHLSIGPSLEKLLKVLPAHGLLFPNIAKTTDAARAAEFCRRKRLCGLHGISLHSYRYGWAERAFVQGYAERFAQAALGHKSRAVHHAYARGAKVVCPPLEAGTEAKLLPPGEVRLLAPVGNPTNVLDVPSVQSE